MAKDDRPADDLQRIAWTPVGELPGEPTFDQLEQRLETRLDYGDIAQQAEMDGIDGVPVEEPLEMVDAPVQVTPSHNRAKRPPPAGASRPSRAREKKPAQVRAEKQVRVEKTVTGADG